MSANSKVKSSSQQNVWNIEIFSLSALMSFFKLLCQVYLKCIPRIFLALTQIFALVPNECGCAAAAEHQNNATWLSVNRRTDAVELRIWDLFTRGLVETG